MFIEGKKVKKVEGVRSKTGQFIQDEEAIIARTSAQKAAGKGKEKNENEG